MNKKFVFFLLVFGIVISYLFSFEKVIVNKIYMLNSTISSAFIELFIYTNETFNKYFNQLGYIEQLKSENEKNIQYKLMYEKKVEELNSLQKDFKISTEKKLNYERVKVLSYYNFKDHSKVLIDKKLNNNEKIYPLITIDGYSAGIVLTKHKKTVAYLNQNEKCNYTVYIGENDTPGISSGTTENGDIIVKYVPIWKEIALNDEVITSSMDAIFPFGIKVGKVIDIKVYENTKEVLVKPYAKTLGERDFFIMDDSNSSI